MSELGEREPRPRAGAPLSGTKIERKLLAGVGSTLVALTMAGGTFAGLTALTEARRSVRHSLDVIVAVQNVRIALLDVEMGQSTYLLTPDPAHLAPSRVAADLTGSALRHLRELTAGDLGQQRRLASLEGSVDEKLAELAEVIRLEEAMDRPAALGLVRAAHDQRHLDRARQLLDEMHETERWRLEEHETEYQRSSDLTAEVVGGGTLVALVLGVIANLGIRNATLDRKRNELLIQEQAARLEAQATTLREREAELARKLEEQRALTEHLRAANQQLDEHVLRLASAKAAAEQALAERGLAGQALDKSHKDLDQFAYVAAHDLRAPLRGIVTLSEWLEEDLAAAMTDESREHLRLLRGRVSRMEVLIEGILAYSRASRVKSKLEPIEVASMLDEVLGLLVPPAAAVKVHAPEAAPPLVAERAPLQQVWMHLISNALKHGAREGAEIWLAVKDAGDAWECSVRDNGPGIAPEYHERIFRIFHTLASRDSVEGAGIGLAIVKKLVEDRGGRVWIDSGPGTGAALYFTWPKS